MYSLDVLVFPQVSNAFSSSTGEPPLCAWVPQRECFKLDYLPPSELGKLDVIVIESTKTFGARQIDFTSTATVASK